MKFFQIGKLKLRNTWITFNVHKTQLQNYQPFLRKESLKGNTEE